MFAYKYSLTTSQLVVQLEKVQCKPQKETQHTSTSVYKFYISAAANMFQKVQLLFKGSLYFQFELHFSASKQVGE